MDGIHCLDVIDQLPSLLVEGNEKSCNTLLGREKRDEVQQAFGIRASTAAQSSWREGPNQELRPARSRVAQRSRTSRERRSAHGPQLLISRNLIPIYCGMKALLYV